MLILTMHDNELLMEQLLNVGAHGFLLKSDANKNIIEAVERLLSHQPYFTDRVSTALLHTSLGQGPRSLTDRELRMIQLIAEGYTNKQLSQLLHISLKTVESYRAAIMRKLDLNSSAALVRYAVRNRIVEA